MKYRNKVISIKCCKHQLSFYKPRLNLINANTFTSFFIKITPITLKAKIDYS